MTPVRRRLKQLIRERSGPLAALLSTVAEPSFVETCGLIGFDCLILDIEHSQISDSEVVGAIRAGDAVGLPVLVRVSVEEIHRIGHLLDGGCDGAVVARARSVADVDTAVSATHFPPIGRRGAGPSRSNAQGAADTATWVAAENDGLFLAVLIETRDAVEDLDAIIAHPEIDAILMGGRDLSVDFGVPGELAHPEVTAAGDRVRALCHTHEKTFGSMVRNLASRGEGSDALRLVGLGTALAPTVELLHEREVVRV